MRGKEYRMETPELSKEGFRYFAFISYNHRDESEAKKLQAILEHYKLPAVARKEIGEDIQIRPVFRYVSDLGVAVLREKIKQELDASKYLIVICSPHSAKPNVKGEHWVNDEVKRFIALGRQDRIIPVIVDGVPGDEKRECFCPALAEAEIAGVDMQKEKRSVCIQKIVAKLLDLRPDILIQRYLEEQRKRRMRIFLGFLPFSALALLGLLFAWDALRPVSLYFADYVDCYGLPEGIYEVPKGDLRMRSSTYRFDYRGYYHDGIHKASLPSGLFGIKRRLRRVVHVGPCGVPTEESHISRETSPMIMEFKYDRDNRLMRKTYRERGGRDFVSGPVVKKLHYSNRQEGDEIIINGRMWETFDDEGEFHFLSGNATQRFDEGSDAQTRITHMNIYRNDEGRMTECLFLSAPDMLPASAKDGVGGFEYVLGRGFDGGAAGRIQETWHLDTSRRRCTDRYGVASIKIGYEGANIASMEYLNLDRAFVLGGGGFSRSFRLYDKWGNCTNEVLRNSRDEKAFRFLGEEKAATEHKGTHHWAECATVYSNGLMIARTSYAPDGTPVSGNGDIATVLVRYNDLGDQTYREFLDASGSRMISPDGYAVAHFEVERQSGKRTACRTFGKDGNTPAYDIETGTAGCISTLDPKTSRTTDLCYVDGDGKAMLCKDGYAVLRLEYDRKGRFTRETFYDATSNLCVSANLGGNVSCVTWEYAKAAGQWDKCLYWQDSAATKRATGKEGSSGFMTKFDSSGRVVECWDVDEKDVKRRGRKVQYRKLPANEEIVPGWWAQPGWNEIKTIWYASENVISGKFGWVAKREIQDQFSRTVFVIYEDKGGNIVDGNDCGYAIEVSKWDAIGNLTERFWYDSNKNPVCDTGSDTAGYAAEYDRDTGKELRRRYLDKDHKTARKFKGEEYSEIRYSYPTDGVNRIVTTYWHDGKKVRCSGGYHKSVIDTLYSGRPLDQWYYDEDGNPANRVESNGFCYHHARAEYDEWHNRTKAIRYDDKKEIMQPEGEGYCLMEFRYDAMHRPTECLWVSKPDNPDNKPTYAENPGYNKDGVSRMTKEYFGNSSVISRMDEYGLKDSPCLYGSTGVWHKVTMSDVKGNDTNCCYYAVDESPVCDSHNVHMRTQEYFDDELRHYRRDLFGKDIWGDTGVVHAVTWYDNSGRVVEEAYFGDAASSAPIADKNGISHFTASYSNSTEFAERRDLYGDCIWGVTGLCHVVRNFDSRGRLTEERRYGKDDTPAPSLDGEFIKKVSYHGDTKTKSREEWIAAPGTNLTKIEIEAHRHVKIYAPSGKQCGEHLYKEDGGVIVRWDKETGDDGKTRETVYVHRDGLLRMGLECPPSVVGANITTDDMGRLVALEFFDAEGSPAAGTDGAVKARLSYHGLTKLVATKELLGDKVSPCVDGIKGAWRKVTMCDIDGNDTNICTYAVDGSPVCNSNNFHTMAYAYFNDEQRHKRRDLYGKDIWGHAGIAHAVTWLDNAGKVTEEEYFGEGERPVCDNDGVVKLVRKYFPGSKIYGRCDQFGLKDAPCLYGDIGVWHKVTMYDVDGNETNCCTYAVDGSPVCNSNNFHTMAYAYFNEGEHRKRRDLYGKDMWGHAGIAHAVTWYDKDGKVIEEEYFGDGDRPASDKDGVAKLVYEYFPGSKIYGRYDQFGLKDAPCLYGDIGVWHKVTLYDVDGKETNCCTYATDGSPACDSNNVHTRIRTFFDDELRHIRRDLYGNDMWGNPGIVHAVSWYDKAGNAIEDEYFGDDGRPASNKDGLARFVRKYFPDSNIYWRSDQFGLKEAPCLYGSKGVWHKVTLFDQRGEETNVQYFAVSGEPMANSAGIIYSTATFPTNEPGVAERRDLYGDSIWGESGLAHVVRCFDKHNRIVEEQHFDANENPLPDQDGSVRIINEYAGDKKMLTRKEEFGLVGGKGLYGFAGLTRIVSTFDREDGDLIAMTGYDADNRKRIFRHMVVRISEISESGAAESVGASGGDIFCKIDDIDLLSVSSLNEMSRIFRDKEKVTKRIAVARKNGNGGFSILEFDFPKGKLGLKFSQRPISKDDYLRLMEIAEKHSSKEKLQQSE